MLDQLQDPSGGVLPNRVARAAPAGLAAMAQPMFGRVR